MVGLVWRVTGSVWAENFRQTRKLAWSHGETTSSTYSSVGLTVAYITRFDLKAPIVGANGDHSAEGPFGPGERFARCRASPLKSIYSLAGLMGGYTLLGGVNSPVGQRVGRNWAETFRPLPK